MAHLRHGIGGIEGLLIAIDLLKARNFYRGVFGKRARTRAVIDVVDRTLPCIVRRNLPELADLAVGGTRFGLLRGECLAGERAIDTDFLGCRFSVGRMVMAKADAAPPPAFTSANEIVSRPKNLARAIANDASVPSVSAISVARIPMMNEFTNGWRRLGLCQATVNHEVVNSDGGHDTTWSLLNAFSTTTTSGT